jgi:2-keto-4-pentenoate hydratase
MTPQQLLDHADTGELWPTLTRACGSIDLPAAYQAALAVRASRITRGERPLGFKVGFTNRTIWQRYNVFAPIWGSVWNTTLTFSDASSAVSLDRLAQPRIEPEAVFGIKTVPPANATLDDLFDSLDWVAPGFEVVQSHSLNWRFTAPETVADGGLHGRLHVGRRVRISEHAHDAAQLDQALAGAQVELRRDGALVESGRGSNVLDSPLRALLHFLTELRQCPGAPDLSPGDVVTTGTWTDAWPIQMGQTWEARFSKVLPVIQVTFT